VAINYTGFTTRSEFSYDGLSRMVKIVEKTGASINSTRKFVWHGQEKLEFRDVADAVTMRIFPQGQHNGTTPYFFTRDHLGSVRELLSGSGTVVARYDYDPFGRSTTILGTTPTDMNFTGLYRHSKSNLGLAVYRAYDPDLGRWLNRDPIGESGGLNLYAYVQNNPSGSIDPLGLFGWNDVIQFMGKALAKGAVLNGVGLGTLLSPTEIGGNVQPPGPWKLLGEDHNNQSGGCCEKTCNYIRRASSRCPDYFEETISITVPCDQICPASPE
jgi:RHS repeat-associated protein